MLRGLVLDGVTNRKQDYKKPRHKPILLKEGETVDKNELLQGVGQELLKA